MMKKTLLCLALLLAGPAMADELADANALFAKKSYPQALQMYTKLGNAGNVEAQQHLGEMYLYGEGSKVDLVAAELWFKKAAAKGNRTAVAALEMMAKRVERRADMDYWIKGYDGADLKAGQYRCPAPRIPAMSRENAEIETVTNKINAWMDCYNAFVRNLNASDPLVKRIPKEIVDLLTKDELEQATAHLAEVYERTAEDAKITSKLVMADYGVWRDATDKYVTEHNRIVKMAPSPEKMQEYEARKNNYNGAPPQ
jgi:TPR repeat protein